ncbi:siderophore-interacting protein [Paracoccus xiamenensis]|uniref:siderophore-interacting protein n=1 Tax=Paracoccus xiamenensis TaxID=2714901 RepID=UPI00140A8EEC|nr:siderophore-interacting protein [Paracoccus xiamenensis]NHF74326.1 siderophore-interacting protein [Paracoccus xiamenensis]
MTAPEKRRFPITLRALEVVAVTDLSPRMRRVTLAGPQLSAFEADGRSHPGFESPGPDDHIKLFLRDPDTGVLSLPVQGDGRLHWPQDPPVVSREYTPRGFDPASGQLHIDFVLHGHGPAGGWAAQVQVGQQLHLGGPRVSVLLPQADSYLLIGDETALPAIANWLEMLPEDAAVTAHILIGSPDAQIPLTAPKAAQIQWHPYDETDAEAMTRLIPSVPPRGTYIWAGGERAAITALRAHLDGADLDPDQVDLSNYWTLGQAAGED